MRFTRLNRHRSEFEVVVTSMLDINFLLIMFFMVTAHFQRDTRAALDLPKEKGEAAAQVDEAGLVINITRSGSVIVNNQDVPLDQLEAMVAQEVAKLPEGQADQLKLMVRADREALTEHLNRVVAMLRGAGVGVIRVATEVPG